MPTTPSQILNFKHQTSIRSSQKGISLSRKQFWYLIKKVKVRISFDINRLFVWA
jgi:hypothetical protein